MDMSEPVPEEKWGRGGHKVVAKSADKLIALVIYAFMALAILIPVFEDAQYVRLYAEFGLFILLYFLAMVLYLAEARRFNVTTFMNFILYSALLVFTTFIFGRWINKNRD